MLREKRNILVIIISFLLLVSSCLMGYVYWEVTREASASVHRGVIDRVIASEGPVYYDDGRTPIGVFFEKTHRKYISYQDIPRTFVKAIIASEDKNFFSHRGFDVKAMLRASVANFRAGEVVQGGSTITQQTAKNIFTRERRSYRAKLKELVQAFLLERKYTKEEILEMYANQFFVTGYGKGLGIAAQCFFDKEAKDLDLVESAFIAGSVKAPNHYNPFTKKTDVEKKEVLQAAKLRKDYVLSRMLKMNFISRGQYLEARERDVPFKEGKITYRLNVILDYIREQLESDYFRTILQEEGLDNIATSGISVFTSVNKEIQEAALRSIRTHLPLMDIALAGYRVEKFSDIYQEMLRKGLKKSNSNLPFLSRIAHVDAERENSLLVVSWENGGGVIDYEGLKPVGEAWLKWKVGDKSSFGRKHLRSFLENFHVGDLVPVQGMKSNEAKDHMKLVLSGIPELEGGIVVIHKGMVKAMVGGFFNRYFNRAVDAKRQMGSIFKPILYTAALQLKWNALDPLHNIREMFQFETTTYLPRPDHTPRSPSVSMAWAGVKSENLASVWLLYHLTDYLNMDEFRRLAALVGLSRKNDESYLVYKGRIRDLHGVVVDKKALKKAAFEEARSQIEADVIFGGTEEELRNLNRLHFDIDEDALDLERPEERRISRFSFKRLLELDMKMRREYQRAAQLLGEYARNRSNEAAETVSQSLRRFFLTGGEGKGSRIVYVAEMEGAEDLPKRRLLPLTPEWLLESNKDLSYARVWIDSLITSETLGLLKENAANNYKELLAYNRYDLDVLSRVRDFRTLVSLFYLTYLSQEMGISTRLDPVLSFPLGPNSISILEGALAYQTIMTGQVYPIGPGEELSAVPIITKIIDREGEVLWEYKPKPRKVISGKVSGLVTEILRNVMEMGTGSRAKDAILVSGRPIPSFGKTGTANRFTNSSFVGFIPGPDVEREQLDLRNGYVISSYVGYDDNRPMKGEHAAIYGASGALPLWVDTASAIANLESFRNVIQASDQESQPVEGGVLVNRKGMLSVPVSPVSGLPERISGNGGDFSEYPRILANMDHKGDILTFGRLFEPLEREIK